MNSEYITEDIMERQSSLSGGDLGGGRARFKIGFIRLRALMFETWTPAPKFILKLI